ncbi:hypothetical protein SY88_21110 [Clostridiales bacterium PH28_bin88]|nr:hypothetical protein SY88_21110 [Clostridiales bacterium PH28_bin88]
MTEKINSFLCRTRSYLILTLAMVYLAGNITGIRGGDTLVNILALLTLAACLPGVKGASRYTAYVLLALGSALMIASGARAEVWLAGFGKNLALLTLIILVPLLGLPLGYGGYLEALEDYFHRRLGERKRRYGVVMVVAHFLGAMLNLAAIPITYEMLAGRKKEPLEPRLAGALARGYSASVNWSPSMSPVPMAIHYYGVRFFELFPVGFLMGMLFGLVGWLLVVIRTGSGEAEVAAGSEVPAAGPVTGGRTYSRKLAELAGSGAAVLALVFTVEGSTGWGIFTVVPLVSLVYPLVWSAALGQVKAWRHELVNGYLSGALPRMKNEVVLFICAGFFGTAVGASGLGARIPAMINYLVGSDPVGISVVVALMIIVMSCLGVHPVVTGTAIVTSLTPASVGLTPRFMSVLLAGSWALGVTVSPFSGMSLIMAGLTGRSSLEVGPGWHLRYTLLALAVLILGLNALRLVGF